MRSVYWVLSAVALMKLGAILIRWWQTRTDAARRDVARAVYKRRKADERAGRILDEATRWFPFIRERLSEVMRKHPEPEAALRAALGSVPGVCLGDADVIVGETSMRIPAVWASAERRRHGYFVGRTGSGKTTAMLHAIKADIDAGHGVGVIAPEHELFAETLLALCGQRAEETIYLAPGDPACTVTLNPLLVEPGDDRARCAGEVFEILRRAIGQDGFGTRTAPVLANSLAVLVGRSGATLWDIRRLIEDARFREEALAGVSDSHVRDFWMNVYTKYPRAAWVPAANRLDELLRSPQLRRTLCNPSGISIREALARGRILLVDLGRLDSASAQLIGQFVLAKIQIELLRRETVPQQERTTFHLFADELQTFTSEDALRECLSRGRRYGLALTVANQFPSQLPVAVRDEILSNVATICAFSLGAKDAEAIRRELLYDGGDGDGVRPVPLEALVHQPVGSAVAKLGSGALAFRLRVAPPVVVPPREVGEKVRAISWKTFGSDPVEPPSQTGVEPSPRSALTMPTPKPNGNLTEGELRFLKVVVGTPGGTSAEYASLAGMNGTRAARIRKSLVAKGYLKEHKLARKAVGKPALILEPLKPASQVIGAAENPAP